MRDERVLWVFENRVLGKIKRDDAVGGKTELHNVALHNLYTH